MGSKQGVCENDNNEGKKLQKSYFDVLGLCCSSEVVLVERILKNLEGVKDVTVVVTTKTVIVLHDSRLVSEFQIVKALNEAKLEASIRIKGSKTYKKKWPNPYSIASGLLLCLSFLKYIYHPFQWLALVAVAIGITPIAFRAFMALRNFTLDINFLVLIAVGGSIALKDYWEAGTIVFLFTIAEWLESRASHKATAAMSSLANLVPQRAVMAETGEEIEVGDVKMNTLLAVKEGEVIPIDGVVIDGSCDIDQKTLTGESFPVSKSKGSDVWAGTININGYVVIKTVALAEDCVVARMTKLVEEAQSNKSRTERYIETCAKYYTPAIVMISISIAVIPTALRVHNRRRYYHLALVVLVSACPCALILSTPVAMFCALIRATSFGVFFKGAQYVEALAKVKTIAFDKTGTITRGEFEVTEFKPLVDDIDLTTLLYWVSSIERKSSHPLATAVVDYAESNSIQPQPQQVENFQNFVGEGIYGEIDSKQIHIGNHKIATRAGCISVPKMEGNIVNGKSIGYVFMESKAVGIFCLSDICRSGVKEALKQLKSMGIKTAMLTGDCQSAAQHVQYQLGDYLEVVNSDLLPEDKAKIIKEFQKKGFTAMTGDGINDAPAMATSDIGISMGISGSSIAIETANIILMTNDIQRIPEAIKLARKVKWKIIENIFLSIITKSAIICLAVAGHPLVWAAVLADVGTCLVVILNSMLLLKGMPNHGKKTKCCKSSSCSDNKGHDCNEHHHRHYHHNDDKPNQINCCDSHVESSAMDCSYDINSNHLSSTCCKSETSGCKPSQCHEHGIHETISINNVCCGTITQEPGLTSSDNHKEHGHEHAHGHGHGYEHSHEHEHVHGHGHGHGHSHEHEHVHAHAHAHGHGHGHEGSSCETSPHQVSDEQDRMNHPCLIHTKDDTHLKCKIQASNTRIDDSKSDHQHHHHHEGCGDVKSCGNVQKKHMVSCCEDYRKECCINNGHLHSKFRGGLSEIVVVE